ncbi:unnamed protein product, partial [Penicillium salamii]
QTFCGLYKQGVPHIPVTRVECEASKCVVSSGSPIPTGSHALYHSHMTIGGISIESIMVRIVSIFALLSQSTLYIRSCADVFTIHTPNPNGPIPPCEHRDRIILVDWISDVQWVAPRSRMASGAFPRRKSNRTPRNANVPSRVMAMDPVGHVVNPLTRR